MALAKKLNEFDNHILNEGLDMVKERIIREMEDAERNGKETIFTKEFWQMYINELRGKIDELTKKQNTKSSSHVSRD